MAGTGTNKKITLAELVVFIAANGGGTPTGTKLSALTAITGANLATGDLVGVVDVSDTTMAASGTNKKTTVGDIAAAVAALNRQAVNAQTSTTYTLVAADENKLVTLNNASAITLTVASGVFAVGARIDLLQIGAGKVTVAGSGVTVNATPSLGFRAQYSGASLVQYASNLWALVGDLA
jgi:hypothetical protein